MPEVQKVINALTPAGTNITGLVPYVGIDFMGSQVEVCVTGQGGRAVKGLVPGPTVDVYPGTSPANGDLKFTRDLYPGEVVIMTVASSFCEVRGGAEYDGPSDQLKLSVWVERDGTRVANPQSATARILLDGGLIANLGTQTSHDSLGIFTFTATVVLAKARQHIIDVTVVTDEGPKSTNLTLTNY